MNNNKMMVSTLICLGAMVATSTAAPQPQYTTKYDNINLDEILKNDRLFNSYFACIMDKPDAKCTPEGTELKRLGLVVLSKAFGTFASMPAELQPVIDQLQNTIKQEYVQEVDNFNNFKVSPSAASSSNQ